MTLVQLIRLARPTHWIKNVIILFPVVFARRMGDLTAWGQAAAAAVAFCLAASASYIANDIQDRYSDRLHPRKKNRPLASGEVSVRAAWAVSVVLLVAAAAVAWRLGPIPLMVVLSYVLLQMAYTHYLKYRMILDVIAIALGFVLRAVAGGVAIHVQLSPWLFICTFTICLFMGFCKRRSEAAVIADASAAARHRATLPHYTPQLLTHLTTLSAAIAIVSYLLYATAPRTMEHFGTTHLFITLPLVIYGICRFEMLSSFGEYADPTDLILRDRPFQMTVVLWALMVLVMLWQGAAMERWVSGWH
ncbi:MAG: decaprenyl-phosphate phosphoribosyltransferase [Phycisphaerae bacterium]|nr:decaprenyl-phosphate phosphoribosyltransferase [Phycisphaerae bacterium]